MATDGTARAQIDAGDWGDDSSYFLLCTAADCSSYATQEISAVAGDSSGMASLVMGQNNTPTMIAQDTNGVIYETVWLIPSALSVLSVNVLPGSSGGCPPSQDYGIRVDVKYQIVDQNSHPLQSSPMMMMEPQEIGTFSDGTFYSGDIGPNIIMTTQYAASDGTFDDAPVGVCRTLPFGTGQTFTTTQTIQIAIAGAIGSPFKVRDQSFTVSDVSGAGGFDHGSITNNLDITASR